MQLFLESENQIIKSILKYTGNKFKIINEIQKILPDNINTFVDLFCGSLTVAINVKADNIIANDIDKNIIGILNYIYKNDSILDKMKEYIKQFGLQNKNEYINFRTFVNSNREHKDYYLFILILTYYSFNNLFRFNKNNVFNAPYGNRSLTSENILTIKLFLHYFKKSNIQLSNKSIFDFDFSKMTKNDLIYLDPPYLITNANYNKIWNEKHEIELYKLLTDLHKKSIRFVLSNAIKNKHTENEYLKNFLNENDFKFKNLDNVYNGWSANNVIDIIVWNY